jgi:hypothetical protein
LWRIAVLSRTFGNDPSVSGVLARYVELNQLLTEKYGTGKPVEHVEENWRGNGFVMGIQSGRSRWFTDYKTKDLIIKLGIGASDMSSTFWRLIIEQAALREVALSGDFAVTSV